MDKLFFVAGTIAAIMIVIPITIMANSKSILVGRYANTQLKIIPPSLHNCIKTVVEGTNVVIAKGQATKATPDNEVIGIENCILQNSGGNK